MPQKLAARFHLAILRGIGRVQSPHVGPPNYTRQAITLGKHAPRHSTEAQAALG